MTIRIDLDATVDRSLGSDATLHALNAFVALQTAMRELWAKSVLVGTSHAMAPEIARRWSPGRRMLVINPDTSAPSIAAHLLYAWAPQAVKRYDGLLSVVKVHVLCGPCEEGRAALFEETA